MLQCCLYIKSSTTHSIPLYILYASQDQYTANEKKNQQSMLETMFHHLVNNSKTNDTVTTMICR